MQPIGAVLLALAGLVFLLSLSIHKIDEGHVAVYYRVSNFLKFLFFFKFISFILKGWCIVDYNKRSWISPNVAIYYQCQICSSKQLFMNNFFFFFKFNSVFI